MGGGGSVFFYENYYFAKWVTPKNIFYENKLKLSPQCDLRNAGSDQNLSEIKVAGNQKLCTNADFLLIKVQRLQRKLASKFFMDLF